MVSLASLALAAAGTLIASAPAGAATPTTGSAPTAKTVTGSHPSWATAAKDAGAAAAGTRYTATVYLAGRDSAGLAADAKAVSEPDNAAYGKFLSPAAYRSRFGTTPAQTDAVRAWLAKAGVSVVATDAHTMTVEGTNAEFAEAFDTSVHNYRVSGGMRHAPDRNLVVPASVSSAVLGVTGLTSGSVGMAHPASVRSGGPTTAAKPAGSLPTTATCSDYYGQKLAKGAPVGYEKTVPFDECSFYPSQLRKAYGITASGLTGKGSTVAVIDAYGSATMESDADAYAVNHGDKPFAKGQYTEHVDPAQWTDVDACQGTEGWAGEESLDVEMIHGLAPEANVVYVGANSCNDDGLLSAIGTVVDNRLADVISNSWGGDMHTTDGQDITQTEIAAYEQLFQQAAVEGISVNFSSGDCGDNSPLAASTGANCQPDTARAQTGWPDSSPWVTAVGGTALGTSDKSGSYGFETDMGTLRSSLSADGTSWTPFPAPFFFGGGGGTSEDFRQPWYQVGTVPGSLSHRLQTGAFSDSAQRVTPDVAMNGDLYTSVLVGQTVDGTYSELGFGGTSVSSPEFAAVQADAIQAQHRPIGFANPEIYLRSHLGEFRDVVDQRAAHHQVPLSNVVDFGLSADGTLSAGLVAFGQDTSLNAVRGYDDATGVGSPTEKYLRSFR